METHPLHNQHFGQYPALFAGLEAPDMLNGVFRAEFTGPWWLRRIAGPGLWPLGLGGWWGKEFDAQGNGVNLVRRRGELRRIFPIRLIPAHSLIDSKPCLSVRYDPTCPFPWPHVVDELRRLDDVTLLGMTYATLGPLRHLYLPFLLYRI